VETWDAIRSRRNVRSYGGQAIAPEDLDRILEAARRTPSAGNQQAWDFVVCSDREQLAQLAGVWRGAGHVAGSAATIGLVAPGSEDARTRDLIQFDLGQATMSIMLAAPTWASAPPMPACTTRSWRGGCWASPRTGSAPC
jgi:nitroreductase